MTIELAAGLIVLSLIDSTSFGTLLIPIWLLLTPGRLQPGRILTYLFTVAGCYLVIGVALSFGVTPGLQFAQSALAGVPEAPLRVVQLFVGVGLIALSYWLEARARRQGDNPGALQRWRERAMTGQSSARALTKLAAVATALEVATMLPYLIAVGLISHAGIGWLGSGLSLGAYCVVMIVPALALTAVRFAAHDKVDALLQRLNNWLTKNNAKLLGWTVGGLGIGVTVNAAAVLLFDT